MSFSQALSGIRSQGENIRVISDNIANSQTVGFKGSRTAFADIFAGCVGCGGQAGLGVRVVDIMQDFSDGALENTGRSLDLAIAGQGFYRLEKTNGEIVYSRNGQFNQDAEGYLVNANGQRLTGYGLQDPEDPFSDVGGPLQAIQISREDMPPNATTGVEAIFNLNSSIVAGADLETATVATDYDPANPNPQDINFDFSTNFTVFDSLGNERTITIYYRKDAANEWQADIAFDGVIEGFGGGDAGTGTNNFTVDFDTNGALDEVDGTAGNTVTTVTITDAGPDFFALDGATTPFEFDLDLAGTTQFNAESAQNSLTQDGFTTGSLIGIEVEDDGTVTRVFSNEERAAAGQIALANFINPEGLSRDGDNAWREARASGQPNIGVAGTGLFGTIEGQTLEGSNVDLATELVNMIISQRAYQANSTSISTQDELLQTIINL
ncbi:MAG: flagellar hook protein FlgE [Halochromatium sp.]|uniref:flagellar hook protein FlgE n=2 Tax=Halochromatium sp. TaxID=2049430 RepID=UPI00397C4CBB